MSAVIQTPMQPKVVRVKRPRKRLQKMSPEYEHNYRAYLIFKPIYLREHPYCEMFPSCLERSTQIHHMNRHGHHGRLLCYEPWLKASCIEHHDWAETHKNEARELGLILYK